MILAQVAIRAKGRTVPPVVCELMDALQADSVSDSGSAGESSVSLEDVSTRVTADEAGAAVGLSGRQVRNLCAAGLVSHTRAGRAYVVDLTDLRRHLGQAS
ncbi:hypothetical protein [Knoellia koreensis]|uniref:Helix-turn-helix domain-containing protein n=1 Tax=Knoellia koreensis TaxID=2730921 RepID=A0A849HD54_9MICO|nr:hypothetical protein [Knoellia sp. DB2414S]NNM44594.1 hypothetical protein [Knoellia sp. DB2414S]